MTVPNGAPAGATPIVATDASSGQSDTAAFSVTAWSVTVGPTPGLVGSTATARGTGFAGSTSVTLTFNGVTITPSGSSNGTCTFAGSTITTTAAGAFTCRFVIPIGASAGVGTLVANDPGPVQTASAAYTVSAWTLTLSPTTAAASVTITFTGAGFAAGSVVSIQYSGAAGNVAWHAACSTGTGAAGAYLVTVSGGGAFVCTYSWTVVAEVGDLQASRPSITQADSRQ